MKCSIYDLMFSFISDNWDKLIFLFQPLFSGLTMKWINEFANISYDSECKKQHKHLDIKKKKIDNLVL